MQIEQQHIRTINDLHAALNRFANPNPDWVLVFASIALLENPVFYAQLRQAFPAAVLAGCSTAGEISAHGVDDDTAVITTVSWNVGQPYLASTQLLEMEDSAAAGERLASQLADLELSAVLLLGQGVNINGSALIEGLARHLTPDLPIIGGLAGDGGEFKKTCVLNNDGVSQHTIVALGLPKGILVGHGSFGGWKPFGPARKVTRSAGNVLYELDGESALDIYKRYLGDYAAQLPASGLLFPFEMLGQDHSAIGLVRTILGVDETAGSLILAGDILPDGYLRLMHASNDALIEGAEVAANAAHDMLSRCDHALAILVSCVGRKLVMGGRVDEEVEAVADVLGQGATITGFYSYGEISPFVKSTECKLHNQTMTISILREV
ncbi:FIST C-terminal domain-containing protein [Chitinibacter bivalviorum]|uniref:FIST C-terminal domain-containing protein n=1 Tax=Chitinibacter bivalviorum TaxID=2739434 RepID=A0A7H9BKJ6_9NEIS|nr:FIST N-terminal domain-containing protein [Chitinibacter bivalviorum]QLG89190.1 FIST C-terminal domain-containing protein [Chitinibacter bivalviorum]